MKNIKFGMISWFVGLTIIASGLSVYGEESGETPSPSTENKGVVETTYETTKEAAGAALDTERGGHPGRGLKPRPR